MPSNKELDALHLVQCSFLICVQLNFVSKVMNLLHVFFASLYFHFDLSWLRKVLLTSPSGFFWISLHICFE